MFKARDYVPGLFCLDMQKHTDSRQYQPLIE